MLACSRSTQFLQVHMCMSDRIYRLPFTSSEETWRKRLELHLFSMSNHTYHPAAKSSVIPLYEHSNWSSINFATMEIAGEYIAVLLPPDNRLDDFSPHPGTFLLVDWKTGTKHVRRSLICANHLLTIRGSPTYCLSHGPQMWKDLYSYGKTSYFSRT